MRFNLYDSGEGRTTPRHITSIASGIVQENMDVAMQGRVLVRIPAIDTEVWARLLAPGAGSSRGFVFFPKRDDEVLVAFNQDDPNDSYLIGNVWSASNRPPIELPIDVRNKTIIKTKAGHVVELDDMLHSITITTSSDQKIKMSKLEGILIDNGTNKISLNAQGEVQAQGTGGTITISTSGEISIKGTQKISLNAPTIEIKGGTVTVNGLNVSINS